MKQKLAIKAGETYRTRDYAVVKIMTKRGGTRHYDIFPWVDSYGNLYTEYGTIFQHRETLADLVDWWDGVRFVSIPTLDCSELVELCRELLK